MITHWILFFACLVMFLAGFLLGRFSEYVFRIASKIVPQPRCANCKKYLSEGINSSHSHPTTCCQCEGCATRGM